MRRLSLCALVVGCARPASSPPPPPQPIVQCSYDASHTPSQGLYGRVGFGFFPAVSERIEVPLAAGGARTELLGFSRASTPAPASIQSSNPSVVQATLMAVGGSPCQNQSLMRIVTGASGQADVVLFDDAGAELDRARLTVEDTSALEIDRGFSGTPRVLAGSVQGVHATTLGAHGILVGTGAVFFQLEGSLAPCEDPDAAPPWVGGDTIAFCGTPGAGRVRVDGQQVRDGVSLDVIDPSTVTRVTLQAAPAKWPDPAEVTVAAEDASGPVWGAECRWDWPYEPPEWVEGGWIGAGPVARYRFHAPGAGRYEARCTLPGGRVESITLSFD